MSARNEYKNLCAALKRALKLNRMTYKALAVRVGMSESGIKKILGGEDASFQRLSQIADGIGLTLGDLLQDLNEGAFDDVTFTDVEERFLLQHIDHFFLYWLLIYERVTLEEATQRLRLTSKDARRMLIRLNGVGLIKLSSSGKIRLPRITRVRWVGGGAFVEKIYQDWAVNTVRDLARPDSKLDQNELFIIRYLKLQESTYSEFLKAHRELEKEFLGRAIREMNLNLPKMKRVRWVTAIDNRSYLERRS